MPKYTTERWVADGSGQTLRRGRGNRGDPPPPPDIYSRDFETYAVGNPMTAVEQRDMLADPLFGDNATQRALMQVVNVDGEGKCVRITLPATYYTGGNTGVAYSQVRLVRQPSSDTVTVIQKMRTRFGVDFETAMGGKCGPGLGGWTTTTAPVAGYNSPQFPVSGGNTSPYSFSVRPEWGSDGKIHELCYLPLRANYNPSVVVYGIGRSLSISPHVKGDFFDYERRITLNTAVETDTTRDPRTLVQGTLDAGGLPNGDGDYYANGRHEVLVNNVQAYLKTNEVWRLYKPNQWGAMFSYFRGGGSPTWNATAGGSYFDLSSHSLQEAA